MKAAEETHVTPFHQLKNASSFALLGAVVAGMATTIPLPIVATAQALVDFRAVGAVLGLAAGIARIFRDMNK